MRNIAELLTRAATHLDTIADRLADRNEPAIAPVETDAVPGAATLAVIADPLGHGQIIAINGTLDAIALDDLAGLCRECRPGDALHLDLSDATLASPTVMRLFSRLIDCLEAEYVQVRIVGLDPSNPLLDVA